MAGMEGQTAIVTGSAGKIGAGIARRFADEGAAVVVTDRRAEGGEAAASDIREAGHEARFVQADLADPAQIEATVDHYGSIDVLVNSVAAWRHGTYADRDVEDWEAVMDVSLRAPWLTTRYAAEHIPPGSSVINLSSVLATATDPERFPYNVAKSGLEGLTRVPAVEMGEQDIRVNGIRGGDVNRPDGGHDETGWWARISPVGRSGVPEDIAGVAAFLASEDAAFVSNTHVTDSPDPSPGDALADETVAPGNRRTAAGDGIAGVDGAEQPQQPLGDAGASHEWDSPDGIPAGMDAVATI